MFKMYSEQINISQEVKETHEAAFLCVQLFEVEENQDNKMVCFCIYDPQQQKQKLYLNKHAANTERI